MMQSLLLNILSKNIIITVNCREEGEDIIGNNIIIYPNPGNEIISASFNSPLTASEIVIFNSLGQEILSKGVSG